MAHSGVVAIRARFSKLTGPRIERTKRHLLLDIRRRPGAQRGTLNQSGPLRNDRHAAL
jgi:hypothetical protein